jgi:hypothetical protein
MSAFASATEGQGRCAIGGSISEVVKKTSIGALRGRPASRTASAMPSRR